MESLYIEKKEDSPKIFLDAKNGKMIIQGESYPENAFEFYKPVLNWLKEYFNTSDKKLSVDIDFVYCNSATTQILFDIFDLFEENKDKIEVIRWYHDGKDGIIYENYEDFADEFDDLYIEAIEKGK